MKLNELKLNKREMEKFIATLEVQRMFPNVPSEDAEKLLEILKQNLMTYCPWPEMSLLIDVSEYIKEQGPITKLHVAFQLVRGVMCSFATKKPYTPHSGNIREMFKFFEADIPEHLKDDEEIIKDLEGALNKAFKKLKMKLLGPKALRDRLKVERDAQHIRPLQVVELKDCAEIEQRLIENDMFIWDSRYCDFLQNLGPAGEISAKKYRPSFKEKLEAFRRDGTVDISSWLTVNGESCNKSKVAMILAFAALRDKVEVDLLSLPSIFKMSGHLIDAKLSREIEAKFNALASETRNIIESEIEVSPGFNLTPAQDKLLYIIAELLHEVSEHRDSNAENYYGGNMPIVAKNDKKYIGLGVPRVEIYRKWHGGRDYPGRVVRFVDKVISELASKNFPINYYRFKKIEASEELETDVMKLYEPIFKLIEFYPNLKTREVDALRDGNLPGGKSKIIFALNPIFKHEIENKFLLFPKDIFKRLAEASGGKNKATSSTNLLLQYCMRELSSKKNRKRPGYFEITEEKLIKVLRLDKYKKQGRAKLLNARINEDITILKNLKLIKTAKRVPGKTGALKWCITLNTSFK